MFSNLRQDIFMIQLDLLPLGITELSIFTINNFTMYDFYVIRFMSTSSALATLIDLKHGSEISDISTSSSHQGERFQSLFAVPEDVLKYGGFQS